MISFAIPFCDQFLNFAKVPTLFIASFRVFHRRLPLNEREVSPYLFVCTCDSLYSTLVRR